MKISNPRSSFALGLGLGLALLGLVALAPQSEKGALRISLDPDPASIVRIEKGHPFTVPPHRILVLKALGDANGMSLSSIQIKVDGVPVVAAQMMGPAPVVLGYPVTAKPGSVVTVEEVFPDPNALSFAAGYLAY